jgi:hypothetical protein
MAFNIVDAHDPVLINSQNDPPFPNTRTLGTLLQHRDLRNLTFVVSHLQYIHQAVVNDYVHVVSGPQQFSTICVSIWWDCANFDLVGLLKLRWRFLLLAAFRAVALLPNYSGKFCYCCAFDCTLRLQRTSALRRTECSR